MEYKDILVETKGEIGLITMNSPKTFNALSKNMISEIIAALNSFGADQALKIYHSPNQRKAFLFRPQSV